MLGQTGETATAPILLISAFFKRHQLDPELSGRWNNLHGGDGDHLAG